MAASMAEEEVLVGQAVAVGKRHTFVQTLLRLSRDLATR